MKSKLLFFFVLASIAALFQSAYIPSIKIIAFSPFLALIFLSIRYYPSLWIASLCGLFIDLISSTHFGINSLNYCLAGAIVYKYKRFFDVSTINFTIYTMIISVFISVINIFLLFIFSKGITFSFLLIITDIVIMPIIDGIYTVIWFCLPLKIYDSVSLKLFRWKRRR